jgi:uncharacterized protein (DUF1330 family)
MSAYVIVDIEVTDLEGYKEYVKAAPATLNPYGGRYIARGGANETLEGDWRAKRLVILEFPSTEKAKAWWHSPEYAPQVRHHQHGARGRRGINLSPESYRDTEKSKL